MLKILALLWTIGTILYRFAVRLGTRTVRVVPHANFCRSRTINETLNYMTFPWSKVERHMNIGGKSSKVISLNSLNQLAFHNSVCSQIRENPLPFLFPPMTHDLERLSMWLHDVPWSDHQWLLATSQSISQVYCMIYFVSCTEFWFWLFRNRSFGPGSPASSLKNSNIFEKIYFVWNLERWHRIIA